MFVLNDGFLYTKADGLLKIPLKRYAISKQQVFASCAVDSVIGECGLEAQSPEKQEGQIVVQPKVVIRPIAHRRLEEVAPLESDALGDDKFIGKAQRVADGLVVYISVAYQDAARIEKEAVAEVEVGRLAVKEAVGHPCPGKQLVLDVERETGVVVGQAPIEEFTAGTVKVGIECGRIVIICLCAILLAIKPTVVKVKRYLLLPYGKAETIVK